MSQTSAILLANDMSQDQADTIQVTKFYTDVINDLSNRGFFTETRQIDRNADGVTYTKPVELNRILAVFYDDKQLGRATVQDMLMQGRDWRDRVGRPFLYTTVNETADTFRVFPKPQEAAKDPSFIFGLPEGKDFPSYAVSVIATLRRTDVQDWLDLPIALLILEKEYSRESTHTDQKFADLCNQLAELILQVI